MTFFFGNPYEWAPDGKSLLCRMVADNKGELVLDQLPAGPMVQETSGAVALSRTYQDLLTNKTDEANFEYLTKTKLVSVDLEGVQTEVMGTGVYYDVSYSPNGEYLLIYEIHTPYSYLVPHYRFPMDVSVYSKDGALVHQVYDIPLTEEIPQGFSSTRTGPRTIGWRNDQAASVYWVEALDGGDGESEAGFRDALYTLSAPFTGEAQLVVKTQNRYSYTYWGTDELAIVYDYWWDTRNQKAYMVNPGIENEDPKIIFDLNTEDYYADPGDFLTEPNEYGRDVLAVSSKEKSLYLVGEGYGPEGNRPFVDDYDIESGKIKRLWQAKDDGTYQGISQVIDISRGMVLLRIESTTEPPNYYLKNIFLKDKPRQITFFENPYESMVGVEKQQIKYTRDDGVELTADLYLPANYNSVADGLLPMLLWAYPREYKDASSAGQVKESPYKFVRLYYASPIFWVTQGYAVMDNASFPIIGEGEEEPNDSFIEQLVANARAAIDVAVEMDVADADRVAVGGHSYGAFMTANLLAHSDLFAAGIARSGAYNRTLTPFGFQSEERTYWEAPELYYEMSPFMHADSVNEPLLLIHGELDNNSGTFPMQSERFYNAIKGHGGTARLVVLPYESHGYAARENIMHMLWEQDQWLDKYVKKSD